MTNFNNLFKIMQNITFQLSKNRGHAKSNPELSFCYYICPKCKIPVFNKNNACLCEYLTQKENRLKIWSIVALTWFFILSFLFSVYNSLSQLDKVVFDKFSSSESEFFTYAPAGIQIISSLKYSKYQNCIQTIYVHPKNENVLMVLIKPTYWDTLSENEKNTIKSIIEYKWKVIYEKTKNKPALIPEVHIANF